MFLYMCVCKPMYMFMYMYMFMKCLKQLHVAKKSRKSQPSQNIYNYPQHKTAQRVTARCSVIQTSFSLLSSFLSSPLSYPPILCFTPKKKPKLIQTGKSLWHFPRNSGVFCRILVILSEIGGRNKKTPVCNHFGPHGNPSLIARSISTQNTAS